MACIAVLGAGVMGTALTYPLSDNGHDIRLVGTHLDDAIIARCKADGIHLDPANTRAIGAGLVPLVKQVLGL